ncbi:MAG: hypothetical protein ACPG5V_00765 [Vibrio cyclitrophicus]
MYSEDFLDQVSVIQKHLEEIRDSNISSFESKHNNLLPKDALVSDLLERIKKEQAPFVRSLELLYKSYQPTYIFPELAIPYKKDSALGALEVI